MDSRPRIPRTPRQRLAATIVFVTVALGCWPVIPLFDRDVLVLGMPLLMLWSISILFLTTLAMVVINKLGVFDE